MCHTCKTLFSVRYDQSPCYNSVHYHNHHSKMRWQVPRSIIRSWFFICRRREPIIFRMPMELLLDIFSLLELPYQVCLAITCKGLYQLFGSVLQADDLWFPRLSSRKGRYSQTKEYRSRMTLLVQLEDRHWACCAACQKLHPRKEFSSFYMYECPRKRECGPFVRVVDLCPCITLTLRDRKRIMKYLMGKASDEKTINIVNRGLWKSSHNDKGEQCVSHECRPYSMVKAKMTLSLSDDGQLVAYTQYELPSTALRMTSLYICRHSNLFGMSYLSLGCIWNCKWCRTHLVNLTNPRTPEVIVIAVTRYLGKGSWPKIACHEDWVHQGRHWVYHMP